MISNDSKFRNAKPKEKVYKLTEGKGLYLLIQPNGKKYWHYQYMVNRKLRLMSFGPYPEVSLADARKKRDEARHLILVENKIPSEVRKQEKLSQNQSQQSKPVENINTFESIAMEWYTNRKDFLKSSTSRSVLSRLKIHILASIGSRSIDQIEATELLAMLRKIESEGTLETTHRVLQICSQIFRYGIATGRCTRDISADLKGALKPVPQNHHQYLKENELSEFLLKLDDYDGFFLTKSALRLITLTFVRTSELRFARWDEINFDTAEWRIPAERMKMKRPHVVPLSNQALTVLQELDAHKGNRNLIFPNNTTPNKCMSENTILYALYRMGYHSRATGHGFRATASTILNEMGFRSDLIELQLAHVEKNKIRAAYNHSQLLPERSRMMQIWADYLDQAKEGVTVAEFKRKVFPRTVIANEQLLACYG